MPSTLSRLKHLGLALSVFYLLYNLTTVYSASLYSIAPASVHNLATPFDSVIPFVAGMIVPYSWSLILFVVSFFLVRTSTQLSLLTYRLILATIFACLIFYLYPARFSFDRLIPNNWTQFGYRFLQLVDKPFNQLPSLHVSYAILLGVSLWDVAASKTQWAIVAYRILLVSICTLIALSTVLTYQHHVLDVFGGAVLAVVVLVLAHKVKNGLVIKQLTVGATGFLLIAIAGFYLAQVYTPSFDWVEPFAIIIALYWLVSFTLLACAYQQTTTMQRLYGFDKTSSGRLTVVTWIKFAPIIIIYNAMSLLGQWYFSVSKQGQKRLLTPYAVHNRLHVVASSRLTRVGVKRQLTYWLSGSNASEGAQALAKYQQSVSYRIVVIDVAAEISSHRYQLELAAKDLTDEPVHYFYLPLLDLQPLDAVLVTEYIDLFERVNALVRPANHERQIERDRAGQLESRPITLINFHCVMGLSRSIGVQVLYLLYCGELTVDTYQNWLKQHYPHAHLKDTYLPLSLAKAVANHNAIA